MARYREKSPDDLVWNRIRRQITRDLDTRIQNWREEMLNDLLTSGWDKYVAALESGEQIVLADETTAWVDNQLERYLRPAIEAEHPDLSGLGMTRQEAEELIGRANGGGEPGHGGA